MVRCGASGAHRRLKQSIPAYLRGANVWSVLTAPVIYSLILPLVLLDLWVTIYQLICFPIYGIARVHRRSYWFQDRHALGYLNGIEKTNCIFRGYSCGVRQGGFGARRHFRQTMSAPRTR